MLTPKAPIRRFDIFAEYHRIKNEQKGMPVDRAKGWGLWLAKVIAARKFARTSGGRARMEEELAEGTAERKEGKEYPELDGKPQTGDLFDRQIVSRMGEEFYREEFSPAVAKAIEEHEGYEDVRDALRGPWNRALEEQAAKKAA